MNEILVIMEKKVKDGFETTTIFKDGTVIKLISSTNAKETTKIDFVKELEQELEEAKEIFPKVYPETENKTYRVNYQGFNYYSLDLFLDLVFMVNKNKFSKLSAFKAYQKYENIEKENDKIQVLNELEAKKQKLILEEKELRKFHSQKKAITFQLIEKEEFALGESRFFSDTIDIPEDLEIPNYLEFVGQINLNEFSIYDESHLLPQQGTLYFFQNPLIDGHFYEFGKVIYSENTNYTRKKATIDSDMVLNFGLTNISKEIEDFQKRYSEYQGMKEYRSDASEDINKMFGFYTDCQMSDDEIKQVSEKYVVLLQLGSDIYGEGITTFLITENNLKNKNFNNIIYKYVQS